ncbi:YtpR family tRNA-binding protein [Lacticigenium naphthae]|uniref:YtpR family tRNA-binding protein n=1 Tax=Lacticigenium naphthae TaxID=515351 RepID=UPI0004227727|nr:DUF4479 and tRNA-binding domain-containing protein [Lacticigenium naphthae]
MLISTYNNRGLNDVLILMFSQSKLEDQKAKKFGDVVVIKDKDTDDILGMNVFHASNYLVFEKNGPLQLDQNQIAKLNGLLEKEGIDYTLIQDSEPKFVVGKIKECHPVEGSDHLNVTQTEIDNGNIVQIVCGASNVQENKKVVVAKIGAIMPDGMVIWPGELKGTKSYGMICSAKELNIESDREGKGILILDDDAETGIKFM